MRSVSKRAGTVVALTAGLLGLLAPAASASGPYSYYFGIGGGGGVNCTEQVRTASSALAPYIEVLLTGVSSPSTSTQTTANFTASYSGACQQIVGADWGAVAITSATNDYTSIDVQDYAGDSIKLMGGTGFFQPSITVSGEWKL
jgi:hypothetical protein